VWVISTKIKRKRKAASLRVRLFVVMFLVSILPVLLLGWVLLGTAEEVQMETSTQEMQSQALILANQLSAANYMENPNNQAMDKVIEQIADIWGARIQIIDRNFRVISDTYVVDVGKYNISEKVMKCWNGHASSSFDEEKHFIAFTQPILTETSISRDFTAVTAEGGFQNNILIEETAMMEEVVRGVILVTVDIQARQGFLVLLREKGILLEIAVFFLLIPVILFLVTWLLKPFKTLAMEINQAADGDLRDKVNVRNYAETDRISDSFNRTLSRLQMLDESRQEFVSNVSHELKTPITSIRVLADSLMSMENAPLELYQEFMLDISEEIDRESKIIDDLLSLVRLDKKTGALNITRMNINELMELILKRLRPIAKRSNIELLFESFRPVTGDIDEVKLTLAVSNLVENAIKYNVKSGWVKLSLNADSKFFYIKISDSGCGIPEDAQEHIFERFYRVDKARSRETGGTGLGLSITKTIVQLHRGAIKVYSKEREGTTFVVRIPLVYIKE